MAGVERAHGGDQTKRGAEGAAQFAAGGEHFGWEWQMSMGRFRYQVLGAR
jgi:hypothetical protein